MPCNLFCSAISKHERSCEGFYLRRPPQVVCFCLFGCRSAQVKVEEGTVETAARAADLRRDASAHGATAADEGEAEESPSVLYASDVEQPCHTLYRMCHICSRAGEWAPTPGVETAGIPLDALLSSPLGCSGRRWGEGVAAPVAVAPATALTERRPLVCVVAAGWTWRGHLWRR